MPVIAAGAVLQDLAESGIVAKDAAVQFQVFAECKITLWVNFGNVEAGFGQVAGEDRAQRIDLLAGDGGEGLQAVIDISHILLDGIQAGNRTVLFSQRLAGTVIDIGSGQKIAIDIQPRLR